MSGNFNKQAAKFITMLFLVWVPLSHAFPSPLSDDGMVHNNNYDMIMMDDHEPAASMHFQNFDEFSNGDKMNKDAMAEMEMDESRISSVFLAPQPLNAQEKLFRQHLEDLDVQREKRVQRSLPKGSALPSNNANDWEKFDYELFVNHH